MREIDFISGKSTTTKKIPHERAALIQLHGVVVPLFLVAYSNKPLFIVMVLYALYPLVRCITIVTIVKIYSPGKMNQDIQLCCECQDQSSVGDSGGRHRYHYYLSGILSLD